MTNSKRYPKLTSVRQPSKVGWLGDSLKTYSFSYNETEFDNAIAWRHNAAADFLYVEGHKLASFKPPVSGSRWYRPFFNYFDGNFQ